MINTCRNYLTANNTKSIWKQNKAAIVKKIAVCLNLYSRYYQSYKACVEKMIASKEEPFGCSEMYICGKFETFKARLEQVKLKYLNGCTYGVSKYFIPQIADVLESTMLYSILHSSTFEQMDSFAKRFDEMFEKISTMSYDPLDHRSTLNDFRNDYETYKKNEGILERELADFLINELAKVDNVDASLRILNR